MKKETDPKDGMWIATYRIMNTLWCTVKVIFLWQQKLVELLVLVDVSSFGGEQEAVTIEYLLCLIHARKHLNAVGWSGNCQLFKYNNQFFSDCS